MLRVLLTDSLQEVLDHVVFTLGDHFEVRTCRNAGELAGLLEDFRPDLLLLDLSMPGYDPVALLNSLRQDGPQVVVSGSYANDYLVRLMDELGVRSLMVKPLQAEGVALRMLDQELKLTKPGERQLRGAVYAALMRVGVRLRFQGFMTLAEAVAYACTHEGCSMMDELYPHVAEVCGGTAVSVEKAMRRCIEQSFPCRKRAMWASVFGSASKDVCPTNTQFIRHLALAVRKQLRGQGG